MAYTIIDDPTSFFNTVLYTGNATDNRTVTGVGFQPDWSWLKDRTNGNHHRLYDSVRGATKVIYSSLTNTCLLYTSPSPRDLSTSRMPSSA